MKQANFDTEKTSRQRLARLRWGCRRGMLELDVILLPFFERHFSELDGAQIDQFERLLEEADPDLFCWLMGYGCPIAPEQRTLIELIRARHLQG